MLDFSKPKRVCSTAEHNATYTSDTNIAGTYVPNMSDADLMKWKAKKIGGADPRIEIRKTVAGKDPTQKYLRHAQLLLTVRPDGSVIMSANGRMAFDADTWKELQSAVGEALWAYSF